MLMSVLQNDPYKVSLYDDQSAHLVSDLANFGEHLKKFLFSFQYFELGWRDWYSVMDLDPCSLVNLAKFVG